MASLLESVFNHVVLPPKLPGCRDLNGRAVEDNLLSRLIAACDTLRALPGQGTQRHWQSVRQQLLRCLDLHGCRFDRASIRRAFSNLSTDCPVVLHVEEQNCAILVRLLPSNSGDDNVVFEAFEVSPCSETVLAAEGALQWDFPGRAAQISLTTFSDPSFRETLSTFLEQASTETLDRFAAVSRKAGASIAEVRDSANPALISQMLLPLLEAIGSSAKVPTLRKRVRDDINLDKAELPWRRVPYWLVLRVAVQRHLCLALGNDQGRLCYKFLICTLLSGLLTDCASQLDPESTVLLRSKQARRLAKLEMERAEASPEHRASYQQLFESTSSFFRSAIRAATYQVERRWSRYRAEIKPNIPKLPRQAEDADLRITLNNSAIHLDGLLQLAVSRKRKAGPEAIAEWELEKLGMSSDPIQQFIFQCSELYRLEMDIRQDKTLSPSKPTDQSSRLARRIIDLARTTSGAFDSGPEQASISVLSIFDLWVKLDESVVAKCPLLLDYHPGFSPELLDILQLGTVNDMERLRKVQIYLGDRCKRCRFGSETILSTGLSKDCFAARYMAESAALQGLQDQIEAESQAAREEAESRWAKACSEHDALTARLDEIACTCSKGPNGSYGARNCERCRCRKKRKKLRVPAHEDFLPSESCARAAVVLELGMPSYLAAYRDATWVMVSTLAHPSRPQAPTTAPHMRLADNKPLKKFAAAASDKRILSAASAKKSFIQSHFKQVKMKAEKSAVLLPHGLDFRLYDAESQTWVSDLRRPLTFSHLCGVRIPPALQDSVLPLEAHPHHDPDGPSSYQALANQTKCPANMSTQEMLSYQRLLSGRARRWLTLVGELASPHLNFNCEDTMHLVGQLALQAGPARQHQDTLGDVHAVFRDASFCACLAGEIERRLRMIRANWREVYCMETLITLCLRLLWMAGPDGRSAAEELLKTARKDTVGWIAQTREERWRCAESAAGDTAAKYCLWASLLCRRTFVVWEQQQQQQQQQQRHDGRSEMSAEELEDFCQASVALQQNLELSPAMRSMLVRDMKMAHAVRDVVETAIRQHPEALDRAIAGIWADKTTGQGPAAELRCGEWKFFPSDSGPWVTCKTKPADALTGAQRLHFNFVDGRFLIDGSPLSKLPRDIRDSDCVKELFGDQYLVTFPSSRVGMSHVVARRQGQYRIHLGHRNGRVVIQAVAGRDSAVEYVPSTVFSGNGTCGLPQDLVQGCVHWLNPRSAVLEIRRKSDPWRRMKSDWLLDVKKRRVHRRGDGASLVCSHSHLARRVAGILGGFEDVRKWVIFQVPDGPLSIELRNLGLNFFVNANGLLECRELSAEVDPDQDAGTLYGFRSGLVLRAVSTGSKQKQQQQQQPSRSILVPLGTVSWSREDFHVSVRTASADRYGNFDIDQVLGQLTCAPEPELLYTKALLHALTSFALPDGLTRRTGAEESLRTLESGRGQPWQPLGDGAKTVLGRLRGLTPRRSYYPPDMRRFQTARWDDSLTVAIQHASYEPVVSAILERSEQLRAFAECAGDISSSTTTTTTTTNSPGETRGGPSASSSWLYRRAECQRLCYERVASRRQARLGSAHAAEGAPSSVYRPRDRELTLPGATHVYRMARSFLHRPREFCMSGSLRESLQCWRQIGGFHEEQAGDAVVPLADLVSVNMAKQWGSLVDTFCNTDRARPYEAVFKLALLSFSPEPDMDVLQFLAACHHLDELRALRPPRHPSFTGFKFGEAPTLQSLESITSGFVDETTFTRERYISRRLAYDASSDEEQEERLKLCRQEARSFADFLLRQWPISGEPLSWGFEAEELDVDQVISAILPEWRRMHRNLKLSEYADDVQRVLRNYPGKPDEADPETWDPDGSEPYFVVRKGGPAVPLLFRQVRLPPDGAPDADHVPIMQAGCCDSHFPRRGKLAQLARRSQRAKKASKGKVKELDELGAILSRFAASSNRTRRDYGNSLKSSLAALEKARSREEQEHETGAEPDGRDDDHVPQLSAIEAEISDAISGVGRHLDVICTAFADTDGRSQWLRLADLWLWTSPSALLELLRSSNAQTPDLPARKLLVSYGLSVTRLQRLRRIGSALRQGDTAKAAAEWRNVGHATWCPLDLPDWLLLEIDSNLLIRPEQVQVAHAILSPASGSNSVLQMNMGSGKTSCIVPMAMCVLANGTQLARLIVPKALVSQTAQIMQARLGGLVGRDAIHIPFSRRTTAGAKASSSSSSSAMIPLYSSLHEQARLRRGIILAAPEHLLSYKLSGLQQLADSRLGEARQMIAFQARLSEICRDVLDESDYTLGVKTQLIYPSGPQLPLDGQPHRWTVIQALLMLAETHLPEIQRALPRSLELSERPGRFPMAHFLRTDAEDELICRIAADISSGRTTVLARVGGREFPSTLIREILLGDHADPESVDRATRGFPNPKTASDSILLAHGLLQKRILITCLKKRWNVQYGFHPARHPVAVPFHAKGVPSELSEFGHPDVALTLTCLSFYYTGITATQFNQSLRSVLRSDDPVAEYDRWTQGLGGVLGHLCHCNAISLDNEEQVKLLWGILRHSRTVLNYYMNKFVFPIHARQFDVKMQASGWDLPLLPPPTPLDDACASPTLCPMSTGFSGTNDNRLLLPLTIQQQDLDSLLHTNAEVLTYLLQPRSRGYYPLRWQEDRERELVAELSRKRIRVLIDAGAYVLERDNKSLIKTWLSEDRNAKAGVYFGADNQPWVYDRNDKTEALISTPFAEALDDCLVYLDEAHTRGVDLKLPQSARGALTLALGQTKDHTVQAAMRLRALGSTQAVVFFAPPEVHRSIIDTCKIGSGQSVDSSHVVTWLLEQTCHANEQLRGLHVAQGYDFCRRVGAQLRYNDFLEDETHRDKLLSMIRQPERQTLATLYGAKTTTVHPSPPLATSLVLPGGKLEELMLKLSEQKKSGSNTTGHESVLEEVEQEREVEFQAQEVRQRQDRPNYKALQFPGLHPAISRFVETGKLSGEPSSGKRKHGKKKRASGSAQGYQHAFSAMASTKIGRMYGVPPAKESGLFVSSEYMRTVVLRDDGDIDDFLRPVEWILLNPTSQTALIVVPEEAELLIPMVRKTANGTLGCAQVHLITYVLPLSRDMSKFDGVLHSIPPLPAPAGHDQQQQVCGRRLRTELDIFAGRLYAGFDECAALKTYMESPDAAALSANPAGFLLEWLALRRKGQDISHTPVAYVCQGWPLRQDHHLFAVPDGGFPGNRGPLVGSSGIGAACDWDGDENSDCGMETVSTG